MNLEQKSSEQEPQPIRAPAPETVDQTKEGARLNKLEQERIERAQAENAQAEGKAAADRAKAEDDRQKAAKKGK